MEKLIKISASITLALIALWLIWKGIIALGAISIALILCLVPGLVVWLIAYLIYRIIK